MSEQNKDGFGWGDKVDPKEAPRVLLPEGTAMFTVLGFKRSRGECGKYGTQNVALVRLMVVSDVDGTETEIEEKIWLVHALKWKLLQFFTCIGQRKHGDEGEFMPDWSKIEGCGGACEINHRTFKKKDNSEGVVHNIKAFLDAEEAPKGDEGFTFP